MDNQCVDKLAFQNISKATAFTEIVKISHFDISNCKKKSVGM